MSYSAFQRQIPTFLRKIVAAERSQRILFALFSTLLILLFVNIPIEKFIIYSEEGFRYESYESFYYLADDLDNDGNSERVMISDEFKSNRFTVTFYDYKGIISETINLFQHQWSGEMAPAAYDIDRDGFKEIVVVSVRNDSVFLNAISPVDYKLTVGDLYLGSIENPIDGQTVLSDFYACEDFNGDDHNELYFRVYTGHGLTPRGLYRFDFDKMQLFKTPEKYISWANPVFADINHDGIKDILAENYAPSNVKTEAPFSDDRPYIGALDLELKNLFPPIPMEKGYGSVITSPATFSDSLFFALYINNTAKTDSSTIFLMNCHGNLIKKQRFYRHDPSTHQVKLQIIDNKNYLIISKTGKFELTANLDKLPGKNEKQQKSYEPGIFEKNWIFDADNDRKNETITWFPGTSTFKFNNGNKNHTIKFLYPTRDIIINVTPFYINSKVDKLMVLNSKGYFFLHYTANPYYWTKYLIWLAIFFVAYTITFLIQYFQRRRMEQKWETEKQLTELQFNTIRNQLNPHFIFNALNSVGYLIENGQKEEAYDYLSINARLIRKVLEDAELTTRSLEEEIKFVKDYLAIQEFRFKDRYRTVFSIDEDVNLNLAIPKMVLHTYVENSVKHGFKNTYEGGLLEISVSAIPKGVVFKVRDNGNFSKEDDHKDKNTGKGLGIMESYYRLFEKQFKCRIQTTFSKLSEINPAETGTEVIVKIEY